MNVLHLLGATEDHGGIVSVVRGIQATTAGQGVRHAVWVNSAFALRREPPFDLRFSRYALDEADRHAGLLGRALMALPGLLRLVRTEGFDVVHAHTRGGFASAALLNRLFGRRLLFTNHAYANRTGLYRRAAGWPGFVTAVLTPNMARHYGLTPDGQSVVVVSECGADDFWQTPLPERPPGDALRLSGLGNLVRWKKWHLVVEAIAGLPNALRARVEFDLWGPTPSDPAAQAYARELAELAAQPSLQGRVRLRGPTQDVAGVLRQADWFVLPSTDEPCSVALIEALASGVPALVSASGGNVDIVQPNRTGLLFRPDDSADLRAQLERRLRGEFVPAPPGEIRSSVRQRSATAVGKEYLALYRRLAG
jgi:glycosyltransferase involved in cell wall biosynthesis